MLADYDKARRVAVVVFDAFRCSSTLLACFSAGLRAAAIMEKGINERGVSIVRAQEIANEYGCEVVFGGELHGKPIPGGVIGNSPIDGCNRTVMGGRLLHFQSTNFAKIFVDATSYSPDAEIFVASFANAEATAETIARGSFERVYLFCGGFFDCIAAEDMHLGGRIIDTMSPAAGDLDDDSLAMLACFRAFPPELLIERWTARVMSRLGKAGDISDLVGGTRIPRENLQTMKSMVLKVAYFNGVPLITPLPNASQPPRSHV
jgi:phosphosulfolactate phosphohydrolase-like enzyme